MMQAPPGIFALYTHEGPPRRVSRKSVIAFSDDGAALVAGQYGSLVQAGQLAAFDRLTDGGDGSEFTALIPAGGWRIEHTRDDGTTQSEPLVAWAITGAGRVTPLCIDGDNLVMDTIDYSGRFRVYHPDGTAPQPGTDPETDPSDQRQ
ncbi:MAG TPA: hypothetical protein VGD91_18125 [Trebonia sp.]